MSSTERYWPRSRSRIPRCEVCASASVQRPPAYQIRFVGAAWERVGPLDERYFIYAEDADWSLRARAAGFRLLFVPTARLWHRVSASAGAGSPWKIYQRLRANLALFGRHARGVARLTWWPAFLVQQGLLMLWLVLRGHGAAARAVPRALWDAARGRPAAGVAP